MEEKYPTLNFCLLSSEKRITFLYCHNGIFIDLKYQGECRTSVKSQFSPMSCKAELLTLCSYCECMACFLSTAVPEGIPIVWFGGCSCSRLPNCIRLA